MKKISKRIFSILAAMACVTVSAQSVTGTWKTFDEDTGQAKSVLSVYQEGGLIYGKVVRILEEGREDAHCLACDGDLKNRPIKGMVIMEGLSPKGGDEYAGGTIMDPENGQEYRCKIWLDEEDPNQLNVRGYVALFYRTQTWQRVPE